MLSHVSHKMGHYHLPVNHMTQLLMQKKKKKKKKNGNKNWAFLSFKNFWPIIKYFNLHAGGIYYYSR